MPGQSMLALGPSALGSPLTRPACCALPCLLCLLQYEKDVDELFTSTPATTAPAGASLSPASPVSSR